MEIWRKIQRENFTSFLKLCEFLEIDSENRDSILNLSKFPLNLPLRLAKKIEKNNLNDPIFLQLVPLKKEKLFNSAFSCHPVLDLEFAKSSRLIQKYKGRALLLPTSACAMHCRFCFRQNYPYETTISNYDSELNILRNDNSIHEIILSGGDPLSLSDSKLCKLISSLEKIPHLKLVRFHTRFPIGIPERITSTFLKILETTRLQTIFVIHINHPKELDLDVSKALKKVQKKGIPVLVHTVLLKGVNDDFDTLKELFLGLAQEGFIPYYLNQLDKVQGSAHFEVSLDRGKQLVKRLREQLPGYAVPRFIQETPHEKHKTII